MSDNKEGSGCLIWVVVIALIMLVGAACDHLNEEVQKLDGLANFTLGIIVCGLFYGLIYFAIKSNDK
jgi:hypothetical protein